MGIKRSLDSRKPQGHRSAVNSEWEDLEERQSSWAHFEVWQDSETSGSVESETPWDCSGCSPGQSSCAGVKKSSLEQPHE